jgi:hypothetical protein
MGRIARTFLIVASALCVSVAGFGAEKTPAKPPSTAPIEKSQPTKTKTAKTPKALKYRGDISAIDPASGAVSVKGQAGEKQFVTQDAAKDAVERLSVGDNVRVIYSEKDKKLVATSVRRLKAKQVKAAATKAADSKSPVPQKDSKAKTK